MPHDEDVRIPAPDAARFDEDAGALPLAPDAGMLDGGSPSAPRAIERLDWRRARGPQLPTAPVRTHRGSLFAVSGDGYVIESDCDAGSCDYGWFAPDGGAGAQGQGWSLFQNRAVSPDGRSFLVQENAVEEACPLEDGWSKLVRTGTMKLVDLETGAVRLSEPGFRTNVWTESTFTQYGRWFVTTPLAPGECEAAGRKYRAVAAPHAAAAGAWPTLYFEHELADGRVLASDDDVGILDPSRAGSFQSLASDASDWARAGGYAHAFIGSPLRRVESLSLATGARSTWIPPVTQDDWFPIAASERWVLACSHPGAERKCRIRDARGERPDEVLTVDYRAPGGLALAGAGNFLLFREPVTGAPQRLDLVSGARAALPSTQGTLTAFAAASAGLLRDGRKVWLVERDAVELLADDVDELGFLESGAVRDDLPQRALLVLVRSSESRGQNYLSVYNARARRLAALTDSLYFHAEYQTPFSAARGCGMPWVARSAGAPLEAAFQPSSALYFAEFLPVERRLLLWMLPVELTAPPRLVGGFEQGACLAPMVSADGKVVSFARPLADGATVEIWRGALQP